NSAGARIILGTGSTDLFNVPGFSVHRELSLMSEAGMNPYEVLESATRTVARYVESQLDQPGDFGAITPGYVADLVLLNANPLDSVDRLSDQVGVMVRGI